jgi:light-regulated signal transduction histidine kinase (bacteriophytochrome)
LQNPGTVYFRTNRFKCKNGKYIWAEGTVINLLHDENVRAVVSNYRDVTERKEAEQKILQLNEELEAKIAQRTADLVETNRQLEAFTYSVSHDLRNPLNGIIGVTHLLEDELKDSLSEENIELFNVLKLSGHKMNTLISDLLAFSRVSKNNIEKSWVNVNEVLQTTWANLQQTAPIKITIEFQSPIPSIYADKAMLQQVIVNLLSNAIKYSSKKENPKVEVGAIERANDITYYIKDNGAGFDMKHYDKLFEVFQRLHTNNEFEGTGVGLAIVKQIIEKHGGNVWAESELGEWAKFSFALQKNE